MGPVLQISMILIDKKVQLRLPHFQLSFFWATVCKTVRPMLSDRCPVCPVLSLCNVGVLWSNSWMD